MTQFRIAAKKIFLTYSQVNSEITALHVLEQLQSKIQLRHFQYVISKEYHKDRGIHFHVVLIQQEKVDIRNPNALDIHYQEQAFHGNYTPVNSLRHAIAYACKDKEYITNLESLKDGQLLSAKQFIIYQVEQKGVRQALLDYYKVSPEKAIAGISVGALRKHFHEIDKLKGELQLDQINTPFTLDNFHIPHEVQEWIQHPDKTLILVGKSGIGKTQFCKAVVKEKNLKTLVVNHKEDFRRLNPSYDAIIIDDANIHELEETQLLSIIESQAGKSIRVLYDTVIKKAHILQMIAINKTEFQKLAPYLRQPRFARRLLLQVINEPFIININVVNNNVVNHIKVNHYNNHTDIKAHQQNEQLHIQKMQARIDQELIKGEA